MNRRARAGLAVSTARERYERLARTIAGPLSTPIYWLVGGGIVSAFGGAATGGVSGDPGIAGASALSVSLVAAIAALAPLIRSRFREAFVASWDHVLREREEWKARTGTEMPWTRAGQVSWLERHPDDPGRTPLLLALGRVEEAGAAMARLTPSTPLETFELETLRQTRQLIVGEPVDVEAVEALRIAIADRAERRDQVQCRAFLEALVAADRNRDPLDVLEQSTAEDPDRVWLRRPRRFLAKGLVLIAAMPVTVFVSTALLWAR